MLWTRGLNRRMNLDAAVTAMGRDRDRDRLVMGMTQDQLIARFGYIRPPEQVSSYLQQCRDQSSARRGKAAVFLRDSPWMVVMDNRKASELVLCKGY